MKRVLVFVLLLAAAPAAAFEEPDSFRGVPWGATRAEADQALAKNNDKCSEPASVTSFCMLHRAQIGPVYGVSMFLNFGKETGFEDASMLFDSRSFVQLLAIFRDRYGAPTSTREEPLQNRMGAKFTNEIAEWSGEKVFIQIRKYGSGLDKGSANVMLQAARQRKVEEAAKSLRKGKSDL